MTGHMINQTELGCLHSLFFPFPRFQDQTHLVQIPTLLDHFKPTTDVIVDRFTPREVVWLGLVLVDITEDVG